ncbi:hypothetical protein M1O18_03595 [Dehalococcoidia bacterium]|nr:hypothetical protein [Dehalococcoidia bacterium]
MNIKLPKKNKSHGTGEFKLEDFQQLGEDLVFEKGVFVFHPGNIEIRHNVYMECNPKYGLNEGLKKTIEWYRSRIEC